MVRLGLRFYVAWHLTDILLASTKKSQLLS